MKDLFNEPKVLDLDPIRNNILLRFTGEGRNFTIGFIIFI